MTHDKITWRLKEYEDALNQLKEAVGKPDSTYGKTDIVIKRFEFSVELTWKVLKHFLELYNVEAPFPRIRLQEAYKIGWIDDEKIWIDILKDRNLTSHVYDENAAGKIAARVPAYLPIMEGLLAKLTDVLHDHGKPE